MSKEILTREEYKAWKAGGPAASEHQAGATIEALAEALESMPLVFETDDVVGDVWFLVKGQPDPMLWDTLAGLREAGWLDD